jgi:hypothetical protein
MFERLLYFVVPSNSTQSGTSYQWVSLCSPPEGHNFLHVLHIKSPSSQVLLLPARPGILVEMPLHIALLVLQRSCPNLKQPHRHARAHFRELDGLVARLDEDVMADFDGVFNVFEAGSPLAMRLG